MPQFHDQVAGGSCSLTLYLETSPGIVAPGTKGTRLSFMNERFAKGSSKRQRSVITGRRGSGKPREGMPEMSGSVAIASYSPQLGHLFCALCGAATSTPEPERALDAAAVTQVANGVVGLPCAAHGFVQDAMITIHGTQNYDGTYRIAYGVSDDIIAIRAPFVAETLAAGAKAYRGRAPLLEGAARDLGNGLVGLPVKGGIHILNAGESVNITGSATYNGIHELQDGSEDGLLVIEAAFADEEFDGGVLAVPLFYRHAFELPKRQPTVCMEKYLDFEDDATLVKYQRFGFCKVNGFSFNLGGDDELVFNFDFAVGQQEDSDTPLDAAPAFPPAIPMDNIEAALWLAKERRGDVQTGSFSNTFAIEAKAAIGDLGNYSRMAEGDPTCNHTLQTFLEEGHYQALSASRATVPFSVSISCSAGDEIWFNYPETEVDTPGTPITGKEGLMQEVTVMSFVDKHESVLNIELINRVAAYA